MIESTTVLWKRKENGGESIPLSFERKESDARLNTASEMIEIRRSVEYSVRNDLYCTPQVSSHSTKVRKESDVRSNTASEMIEKYVPHKLVVDD